MICVNVKPPVYIVRKMNGARQAVSLTRYMNTTKHVTIVRTYICKFQVQ